MRIARTLGFGLAALIGVRGGVALAKLPPPTPEQEQAAAAKKETEKANLEKEKQALEKAQDRVAEYYKRTKGGGGSVGSGAKTEDTNISAKAVRAPRSEGPV